MSSNRPRQRTRCTHCLVDCRVTPIEFLRHVPWERGGYWRWILLTLCPPCQAAFRDWWREPDGALVAGHP